MFENKLTAAAAITNPTPARVAVGYPCDRRRFAMAEGGTGNLAQLGYSFGFMQMLILIAAVNFNPTQQTFVDSV